MCTVTYIPQKEGFILTSNRDERITRRTSGHIVTREFNNVTVYFPQDLHAGGTWIAAAENGYSLCLLNGAFEPHVQKPVSKKSRGLMLLDFFSRREVDPQAFAGSYDFLGIEPFTLLFACHRDKRSLHELRWDGKTPFLSVLDDAGHHIWSSVMLYKPETIAFRNESFQAWMQSHAGKPIHPDKILHFHHFGADNVDGSMKIDRGDKKTVSVCSIRSLDYRTDMWYEDLVGQNTDRIEFTIMQAIL